METKSSAALLGACHAVVLLVLGAVCLCVHFAVKPFQRAFYCDDESIGYPLHEGTVPFSACVGVAVPLAILTIVSAEALRHSFAPEKLKSCTGGRHGRHMHPTLLSVAGKVVPDKFAAPAAAAIAGLYQLVFAGLVNELFTVVGKMGFGRQRPHFLAACQLNTTCQPGRLYTPDFCLPPSKSDFANAQKSFPSGHSSFSMVICVYLALYLQARLAFRHPLHSVKNLVQAALVLIGGSVAMSRVSDYKHHWSDILVGGLIGTVCAALVASKFFAGCSSCGCGGGGLRGGSRRQQGGYTVPDTVSGASAATAASAISQDARIA